MPAGVGNYTKFEDVSNITLHTFLYERFEEYIAVVPIYWLEKGAPTSDLQLYISIVFFLICIPGNLSQLLVMVAYVRLVKLFFFIFYLRRNNMYTKITVHI